LPPLDYDWPNQDAVYSSKHENLFGDSMPVAPVPAPEDKVCSQAKESAWLPDGDWLLPKGGHFSGPAPVDRNFTIDQVPVYLNTGAIVPLEPSMLYSGQKRVDPLIVNVWPLKPGSSSSYSVYENSGISVENQRGVFTRLPIKAAETGDTLTAEIGPVEGGFPSMLNQRAYELRLLADWPPDSVTVNGVPVVCAASASSKDGWSFEGNTLTTVIPVPSTVVTARVTVEVRRAPGMTARRGELDGFPGEMTPLRNVYDAMGQTEPADDPTGLLVDAMQSGDRLGYNPENVAAGIAHFQGALPRALARAETQPADVGK
jgi:alpha-glucosidase